MPPHPDRHESRRHDPQLRGALYAPDFCINSGGLISPEEEILGHDAVSRGVLPGMYR